PVPYTRLFRARCRAPRGASAGRSNPQASTRHLDRGRKTTGAGLAGSGHGGAMTAEFTADWLALREPADAEARNRSLVAMLLERVRAPLVGPDLGSGTGAHRRSLDPALPKPQQWVLHEQEPDPVARAERSDADVRVGDFMMLRPEELLGASLVTAS